MYKNIIIGVIIRKKENENLEAVYPKVMKALFYATIAGKWEYEGNCFLSAFADYLQDNKFYLFGCRVYADNFIGIFTLPEETTLKEMAEKFIEESSHFLHHEAQYHLKCNLGFIFGICAIDDKSKSIYSYISKAHAVRKSLKPSLSTKGGVFDEKRKNYS